ncbi:MAG TPA: hypothetical protein VF062_23155 [Candidatus Limnocylindrales bacterium]
MLRRLLWLGVGIGIGVAVVRVVTKKLAPSNLAGVAQESIGGAAASVRNFIDDVRDGMHDREDEIRAAFAEGVALDTPDLPWAQGVGHRFSAFRQQLEEQLEEGDDAR